MPTEVNPNRSLLDQNQVIQRAFDEDTDRLRVDAAVHATIPPSEISVAIDAATGDNISLASADGSKKVDVETVSGKNALDVNVKGGSISSTGTFTPQGLNTLIKSTKVTVTDVATKIPTTAAAGRNGISVRVWGSNIVYFSDSTVTTDSYPKRQFEEIILDVQAGAAVELWGICDPGKSCEVRVLEIG